MTEVETLLSVDKGQTPPGALAFYPGDEEAGMRRARAVFAVLGVAAAVACACLGVGLPMVMLLLLGAGMLGVTATRTLPDEEEQPAKPQILVVTPAGLIERDELGLRSWRFDDLVGVRARAHQLHLIDRNGTRHTIDYLRFQRADQLRDVICRRLPSL
jgi:hypothetical protein